MVLGPLTKPETSNVPGPTVTSSSCTGSTAGGVTANSVIVAFWTTEPWTTTSTGNWATGPVGLNDVMLHSGDGGGPSPGMNSCAPALAIGNTKSAPSAPSTATPMTLRTDFRTIASSTCRLP